MIETRKWLVFAAALGATLLVALGGIFLAAQGGFAEKAIVGGDDAALASALRLGADPNGSRPATDIDPDSDDPQDPTIPRITLLQDAVVRERVGMVALLLSRGADPGRVARGDDYIRERLRTNGALRAALRTSPDGSRLLEDYGVRGTGTRIGSSP